MSFTVLEIKYCNLLASFGVTRASAIMYTALHDEDDMRRETSNTMSL